MFISGGVRVKSNDFKDRENCKVIQREKSVYKGTQNRLVSDISKAILEVGAQESDTKD